MILTSMRRTICLTLACLTLALALLTTSSFAQTQKLDEGYTAKIREYTTDKQFSTELVDHLPASATVPTTEKVLGYVAGAPNKLTYTKDIYRYMREIEKNSKRVKVFSIGRSEEGRETLLVAISDEANLAKLDRYKQITAQLADPRQTPDAEAKKLIAEGLPIYWATGSIHSPETGSPEMLMELAYRLAVEETPFLQHIRKNLIVMLTPSTEVDGRDRMVDLYNWKKENPGKQAPSLVYWGKYVAHDNNRDSMSMALQLSKIVMSTFFEYHPTVLHDLHESVPFLYTSTGMGPYNAWLDPIVVNEWQKLAYHEIEEMTKRGVVGVWTHGFYDGWAPNYMFYAANGHNSIGRFYETFGNGGADTQDRTVPASQTSRTWFRPNPPLAKVKWSMRNNNNMQQSAILFAMHYTATNKATFLENFYAKGKRSVAKATTEGPAAWVIPSDDTRPAEAVDLLRLMQLQGIEVHKTTAATEVANKGAKTSIPAGSYVIRMDQPYSRMADMLLDTQYYNVSDPAPYDDTGWTLGALRNVKTVRVTDTAILNAAMAPITGAMQNAGSVTGSGGVLVVQHNTDNTLATFRYRFKNVKMLAAEDAFEADGKKFNAGSFLISEGDRSAMEASAKELGLIAHAVAAAPKVATHEVAAPRIALIHTWTNTQDEGWYRIAFDQLKIPFDYISDHKLRETADLRGKWDVLIFGPVRGTSQRIVNGITGKDPIPWKQSAITPNFGNSPDQTDDMRGGMGLEGLVNVQKFIHEGGLMVFIQGTSSIPIDFGLIDGISIQQSATLRARGTILLSTISDKKSPIAYGYGDKLAVYFNQAPIFNTSAAGGFGGFGGGGGPFGGPETGRPTGRGTATDPDIPQGRAFVAPAPPARPTEDGMDPDMAQMLRANGMLPDPATRPRVILRFAEEKDLLVSGMLAGGRDLAGKPAVVDVPKGKGHVLLFATNPMWRNETQGSYFLLFNAMFHYKSLDSGRPAGRGPGGPAPGANNDDDQN